MTAHWTITIRDGKFVVRDHRISMSNYYSWWSFFDCVPKPGGGKEEKVTSNPKINNQIKTQVEMKLTIKTRRRGSLPTCELNFQRKGLWRHILFQNYIEENNFKSNILEMKTPIFNSLKGFPNISIKKKEVFENNF